MAKTNFLVSVLLLCLLTVASYASDGVTKRQEMLYTSVFVETPDMDGSGTVVGKIDTEMDNVFRYLVLTNEHVIKGRFTINPKFPKKKIDRGCVIWTFNHTEQNYCSYPATVVSESKEIDIALLAFTSSEVISVAKFATQEMLNAIGVFDEVFAIGCNLKDDFPGPTIGIISLIYTEKMGKVNVIIYANTAQLVPGASGGGLFREYDGHYYLIGIPFRLDILDNDQLVPHLAEAIAISAVKNLIHTNKAVLP